MDGPPLHPLASQASHAAAEGRPPDQPQRTASSPIDSQLGGVGGDVVFSAGTRRVPFTPAVLRGRNCVLRMIRSPRLLVTQTS